MSEKYIWDQIPADPRKRMVWALWFVTWLGLIGGLLDRIYFEYVVVFSALHSILFLALFRFDVRPFPVQVRIAYLIWVAVGTYVPYARLLLYITLIGLGTNLFVSYCPLARIMYLMPWNNDERFSLALIGRVFLTPPVAGKFRPH